MQTQHQARLSISPLTLLALALILGGIVLAAQDIQWQLISMASFHGGILLTLVGLCLHLLRQHQAWHTELLILVGLASGPLWEPVLPLPLQDLLQILMP